MALITDAERGICERQGWRILDSGDGIIELESKSPAGEDIVISIQPDESLCEGVKRNYDEFDVDDHVELLFDQRGKNGVPKSVRELLEDAEAIERMLWKLEMKLRENLYRIQALQKVKSAGVGDVIEFGAHADDVDYEYDPAWWLVLKKKKDKILVISEEGEGSKPYHDKQEDVTWENCSLRKWLNNEFLNTTFTDEEKQMIILSHIHTDPNPKFHTNSGNDTKDRLFLLSIREAKKYFPSDSARAIYRNWWLRTPGTYGCYAAYVCKEYGDILYEGDSVDYKYREVRPAMWIKIGD